jgi:hypothetical protein
VDALRRDPQGEAITLDAWTIDVAEELASDLERYAGKAIIVQHALLAPGHDITMTERTAAFALRGGGLLTVPVGQVPEWLRQWTGAPVKFTARVHPPRGNADGGAGPLLTGTAIDFAHPLELAHVSVDRGTNDAWMTAHVENYRGEPADATLALRFGEHHASRSIHALEPGRRATVRLRLYGGAEPRWRQFAKEARRLTLTCDDGSSVSLDIARWLEERSETVVDWGYTFQPPANALLALSEDGPEAELERFAALELRSYLEQFTNANIQPHEPTDGEWPPGDLPLLVVGTAEHNPVAGALLGQAPLAKRLEGLGPEGYVLKSLRQKARPVLLVAATTPRALMHGVYGLLDHYGVRFTMHGARLPGRQAFRLVDVDEARQPAFSVRRLVAAGRKPDGVSRWAQWRWISLFDLAAKNRFNEVVWPLDGLEATFSYTPGLSRDAVFPFDVGTYLCVAEAYLAHQRGMCVLADYARRRGLDLTFAHRGSDGTLRGTQPPVCVADVAATQSVGKPIEILTDPGDRFAMPRVMEAAEAGGRLLRQKDPVLSLPYSRGAGARVSFLAKLAWDTTLTPKAYFQGWAETLTEGQAAERLANALLAVDKLDSDLLAALPEPLGQGPGLVTPIREADLACHWDALKARAGQPEIRKQLDALEAQGKKLRDIGRRLQPIQKTVQEALGTVPPPWEEPLFESASATSRAQRIISGFYRFRGLLGGLANAQEAALAYYAAIGEPQQALPRLLVATGKLETALRLVGQIAERVEQTSYEPVFDRMRRDLEDQRALLHQWLGPAVDATAVARLGLQSSDAVVHLFRKNGADIYGAYKVSGREVVQLRLRTETARLVRRGEAPKTIHAEGGVFLISLDTVPTYIIARRAAWLGPGGP